jgi:hypothetical protein
MKKKSLIIGIVGLLVLFSISIFTVKMVGKRHHKMVKQQMHMMAELSSEQLASMKTKKMTFYLDLNDSQQKSVQAINVNAAKFKKAKIQDMRENGRKCDAESHYKMINDRMDKQIAIKNQLKKVLSEEQMDQWTEMQTKEHMFSNKSKSFDKH